MKIIDELVISNFKVIEDAHLNELRSINFLVGPNNTGKSSILEVIQKILGITSGKSFLCDDCQAFVKDHKEFIPFAVPIAPNEIYYRSPKNKMTINITFDADWVEKYESAKSLHDLLNERGDSKDHNDNLLRLEQNNGGLQTRHIYPIPMELITKLKNNLIYIKSNRLMEYNGSNLELYAQNKGLIDTQKQRMKKMLVQLIDRPLIDQKGFKLIHQNKKNDSQEFTVAEQGSGFKALYGPILDFITNYEPGIVLFDEPETGLNQVAKTNLIKLIRDLSGKKQFFIATQDSSVINPLLLNGSDVSVYVFSPVKAGGFKKVDFSAPDEHLSSFAGFLPHTVSTKAFHIYVEGASDVFVFKILLRKYLKKETPEDWFQRQNNVELFSLGGSYWPHLLYTLPKNPFKCIVILDGDKREEAKRVMGEYKDSLTDMAEIMFCDSNLQEITNAIGQEKHPLYCLKKDGIESYLGVNFKDSSKGYKKGIDGPKAAEELSEIPQEISVIFDRFFNWGNNKYAALTENLRIEEK